MKVHLDFYRKANLCILWQVGFFEHSIFILEINAILEINMTHELNLLKNKLVWCIDWCMDVRTYIQMDRWAKHLIPQPFSWLRLKTLGEAGKVSYLLKCQYLWYLYPRFLQCCPLNMWQEELSHRKVEIYRPPLLQHGLYTLVSHSMFSDPTAAKYNSRKL